MLAVNGGPSLADNAGLNHVYTVFQARSAAIAEGMRDALPRQMLHNYP